MLASFSTPCSRFFLIFPNLGYLQVSPQNPSKTLLPVSSSGSGAVPTSFPYSSFRRRNPRPRNHTSKIEEDDEEDIMPRFTDDDDEIVIGDCLIFEDGAFESGGDRFHRRRQIRESRSPAAVMQPENLIPEKWMEAAEEIRLSKKEKRKISHELRFGRRLERGKKALLVRPPAEEYQAYKEFKLAQVKPVVLDDPEVFPPKDAVAPVVYSPVPEGRVAPRNPRTGLSGGSFDDITKFLNSAEYVPGEIYDDKKPRGSRKLFTREEKVLLNKRVPNVADATSSKWIPLHTLAASGELYLMDSLLKHNVDINAVDKDGLTAIHKAILGKKQAIINYLLRESANPFVLDNDGATLMHYAVQTASAPTIKILLLYNVDINKPDNDGWSPLHLAVQTRRTDVVRLLLIKGAERTLKNQDGLTPLEMCLYSGRNMRTYELIKLLKAIPRSKPKVLDWS